MRDADDFIRRGLERLARPGGPGSKERLEARRTRLRWIRRARAVGLASAVLAASAGGIYGLGLLFDTSGAPGPQGSVTSPTAGETGEADQPRIAFASDRDGDFDIYLMDGDGTDVSPLTDDPAADVEPAWSPDGTRIAFSSDRGGRFAIYAMNADGSGLARITDGLTDHRMPTWSPDGSRIAFTAGIAYQGIYVTDIDGTALTRLTDDADSEWFPAWSPDGAAIAYERFGRVYVMNPDGTDRTQLTDSEESAGQPAWSPDGEQIAFFGTDDLEEPSALVVIGADGTGWSLLAEGSGHSPSWTPDGSRLAFTVLEEGGWDLYALNADGTGRTRLTDHPDNDEWPRWQPTGGGPAPSPPPPIEPEPEVDPSCDLSSVGGQFGGDGEGDLATVWRPACLAPFADQDSYGLHVRWGSGGGGGAWDLPECDTACLALAAADLNKDGTAELILVVDQGASTDFLQVYSLPFSPPDKVPVPVAPPGAPGFPGGAPAVFPIGGSVTHLDFMTCDEVDGAPVVISTSAVLSQDRTEYAAHETVLSMAAGSDEISAFVVLSTRDYTIPVDSDPVAPGEPCW